MNFKKNEKKFLTFDEIGNEYAKRPKTKFLWSGIKENSFGLIFGPSKSGKTILCEGLAMSIATGAKKFLETDLDGIPKKILFVGLEEQWDNRYERNASQVKHFNDHEIDLIKQNYLYQPIDFTKRIIRESDWDKLEKTITDSKAKVVFIDSITRLNHGNLEDSKTAEEIMQKLREVCYNLKITLICIHHTPKMRDQELTMNCIKGSSTFAQESDFAIGMNRTSKGHRYVKNVFFRYAKDDDDTVKEVEIDDFSSLQLIKESEENEILVRSDRRRNTDNRQKILDIFKDRPNTTITKELAVNYIMTQLNVKERMAENYLKEAIESGTLMNPTRGYYRLNTGRA